MRRLRIKENSWPVEEDPDDAANACGEQLEWGIAIPWTFRALHVPRSSAVMPAPPRPGDDVFTATAYWGPLMHLLAYSLAWSRPFRGLNRWYEYDRPIDDPRFALISDIWGADGHLDWFYAWMWERDPSWAEMFDGIADTTYFASQEPARPSVDLAGMESLRRSAEAAGFPTPLVGGSDPLHLGSHWSGPLDNQPRSSILTRTAPSKRTAVFVADSMTGWYRQLATRAAELPQLSNRSWHIEAVVKPAGWLGTYRRSRITGLWFNGPHSIHMYGN